MSSLEGPPVHIFTTFIFPHTGSYVIGYKSWFKVAWSLSYLSSCHLEYIFAGGCIGGGFGTILGIFQSIENYSWLCVQGSVLEVLSEPNVMLETQSKSATWKSSVFPLYYLQNCCLEERKERALSHIVYCRHITLPHTHNQWCIQSSIYKIPGQFPPFVLGNNKSYFFRLEEFEHIQGSLLKTQSLPMI